MANTIKLKRSSTANSVPSAGSLEYGELALNYTDGNLFFKTAGNAVTLIASTKTANYSGSVDAANFNVTSAGNVRWYDSDNSNFVAFKGPSSVAINTVWILPQADGASGTVLSTDGAGTLSWIATGGSGQGGFFNSTLTIFPGSTGNADYGNGESYVGQAASTDPFGVNLINNYDNMDPSGAVLGPYDLGVVT